MNRLLYLFKHHGIAIFGLVLSLAAVVHTMVQLSDDILFRGFFGAGGIFAVLFAQQLRGKAAAYRKRNQKGDKGKAFLLWVMVIMYIVVFEFVSAYAVLISQADKGEQAYTQIVDVQNSIKDDLKTVKADMVIKKAQRDQEFQDKGRGPKYDRFETELKVLEIKKSELETKLTATSEASKTVEKTIFIKLSEKLGIPAGWVELAMFAGLMFLIYSAPLMNPWKIDLNPEKQHKPMRKAGIKKPVGTLTEALPEVLHEAPEPMPNSNETMTEPPEPMPSHDETKEVTPEQQDIIKFTEELWGDNQDQIPKELTALKNISVTDRKTRKYSDYLESIGAIEKGRGVPPRAMWEKQKVIDYIKNHDIAI